MNNILNFIIKNIGLLMVIVIALAGLFKAIISKNKQQIYTNIYSLVSEAEQLQQSNTDKFNFVLDKAYNTLPKILKFFIPKDDISRAIEYSLNKLKDYAKMQILTVSQGIIVKGDTTEPKSLDQPVTVQNEGKTE